MMETSNEWIIERTGIEERHWVSGRDRDDLATAAIQQALERAGLVPRDIDMIILATLSPDFGDAISSSVDLGRAAWPACG